MVNPPEKLIVETLYLILENLNRISAMGRGGGGGGGGGGSPTLLIYWVIKMHKSKQGATFQTVKSSYDLLRSTLQGVLFSFKSISKVKHSIFLLTTWLFKKKMRLRTDFSLSKSFLPQPYKVWTCSFGSEPTEKYTASILTIWTVCCRVSQLRAKSFHFLHYSFVD